MQNSDINMASHYALQVALQTMKERCVSLQRRLTSLEEENQEMRDRLDSADAGGNKSNNRNSGSSGGSAENFQLRLQVSDLQRQKQQLTEHITMVSNENRKLWSRLSQMAKDQDTTNAAKADECLDTEAGGGDEATNPRSSGGVANQNLIRSKTFTQHSPNPHLRHKVISNDIAGGMQDISLEEVALGVYEGGRGSGAGEDYAEGIDADIGFAYLNVDEPSACVPTIEDDFNAEAKKCIEGMQELHQEALKQRKELDTAVAAIESKIALQPCPDCVKKSQKPEMADKSLETDESLNEIKFFNNNQRMQDSKEPLVNGFNKLSESSETTLTATTTTTTSNTHVDIIQEKIQSDSLARTCPMCGRLYSSIVPFEAFREHVESHFTDDSSSDMEASLERNYEFISHTVGDF